MKRKTLSLTGKNKRPEHVTRGPIFEDIGFTPEEAAVRVIKSQIYDLILEHIRKRKLSRRALEGLLDQPQPRISEFMTGKISGTSIEKLLQYAARLGLHGEIYFRNGRKAA